MKKSIMWIACLVLALAFWGCDEGNGGEDALDKRSDKGYRALVEGRACSCKTALSAYD